MRVATIGLLCLLFLVNAGCSQSLPDPHHLYRGNGAEPESIDPQKVHTQTGINIDSDLFEGLVSRNPQGRIIPAQAKHWVVSQDGRVWNFQLRPSRWSNGAPVTADDFVFAWRRAVDPATGGFYGWYLKLAGVQYADAILKGQRPPSDLGIKALGPESLQVTLSHPVPWFLAMLAHPVLFPVPAQVVKQYGDQWTHPNYMVSNGSYALTAWVPNERMTLSVNPYHVGVKELSIHQVTYLPLTPSYELQYYQAGDLDITSGLPTNYFRKISRQAPQDVYYTRQLGTEYYRFNVHKKPFNDPKLRRALALAIDRKRLIQEVIGQEEIPAYSFLPGYIAGAPKYTPRYAMLSKAQRIAEAKKLYQQAGFSKEHPLSLTLLYNTSEFRKKIAIAVAAMWQQVLGVHTTLNNMEIKSMLAQIEAGDFDIARTMWTADFNDAISMLAAFSHENNDNSAEYNNPTYNKLMTEALLTTDKKKRDKIYLEMVEILNRDMPVIPLYHDVSASLINPRVKGYYASFQGQVLTRYLSIRPERAY